MIVRVASDTNSGTAIFVDEADLTTLKTNANMLGSAFLFLSLALRHALLYFSLALAFWALLCGRICLDIATFCDKCCERASATAELCALSGVQADIENKGTNRDHV
jgi:hypothetical protein